MKYAKFNDDFLSYFRLDDNGETLVLTDKRGYTRAVKLLPYEERPQVNVIPQECMKVLAEAVVDVVQQIDWTSLCEKVAERPQGEWISKEEALKIMCEKCPVYNCVSGCNSYRSIEKMSSVQLQIPKGGAE